MSEGIMSGGIMSGGIMSGGIMSNYRHQQNTLKKLIASRYPKTLQTLPCLAPPPPDFRTNCQNNSYVGTRIRLYKN